MNFILTLVFLSFISSAAADEAATGPEWNETMQPADDTETLAEEAYQTPPDYQDSTAPADETTALPDDAAARVPVEAATSLPADGASTADVNEATDAELGSGIPTAPTTQRTGGKRGKALLRPMPESLGSDDPNGSVFNRELSPDRYKNSQPSIEKEMPGGSKVILLPGH